MTESVRELVKEKEEVDNSLTREKLKKFLPKGATRRLTDEIMNELNSVSETANIDQDLFNEKVMTYAHLIGPGKGMRELANAIKFVLLTSVNGLPKYKAWMIVFPERAAGMTDEMIATRASQFGVTDLVVEIQKMSILAPSIEYAPVRPMMLQKIIDLSNGIGARPNDKVTPTVQLNAAIAAYDIVKIPEESNPLGAMAAELGQAVGKSMTEQLIDTLMSNAKKQVAELADGADLEEVQKLGIVDAEVVE